MPTMRRPSLDLSEPSRNIEESRGVPSPETSDNDEDIMSLPLGDNFLHALDLHVDHGIPPLPDLHSPPDLSRVYRPTQTRRGDSAASSRRNSISSPSLSSSHGAVQLVSGPQSKHVANHQRRDAILKDRQKRLADRAAHVEKVRLRAAMAKERTIAMSVERATAAQQARERNLKEIAAACAEEVKRAKAIAETTKEKRERELTKMRQQMEERQAEAERRREELRKQANRARGSSLGSKRSVEGLLPGTEGREIEAKPLAEDAAVCRIQTWWRSLTRQQVVSKFSGLGLTIEGVSDTPYEKVMEILAQQQVIMLTARILDICGLRQGKSNSVEQMKAVRCFLSSFLILGHPYQVLSNTYHVNIEEGSSTQPIPRDDLTNPMIQDVVGKAKDLLITFECILSRLTSFNHYTVPPALAPSLAFAYSSFETAFLNWKSRDKHALVDGMLGQLIELDALLDHVRETSDPSVVEQYKEGMAPNQTTLIARIKNLLGREQGLKVIRQAITKARKARADKKEQERSNMKPRIADQVITAEAALANFGTNDLGTTVQPEPESSRTASVTTYPSPPSTPASKPNARKPTIKGRLLPDNRIVVHELAINKEYRVRADDFLEAETTAIRPLLDQMRAYMNTDDEASRQLHFRLSRKVAHFIRDKLQRLIKPTNSIHSIVKDFLDVEQFEQRFRNGSFSYDSFFATMGSLLPKLCAPVRDEEVKDLVENKLSQGSYVDRLEALIIFIDIMLVDYANHLLGVAGPLLLQSSADYEAKSFMSAIEQGEHGLFAAETAWRAARNKVVTEVARRDPENINHPKNRPTAERIYVHMLVDIFTQTSKMRYGQVPEMLQLDYKRVRKYGHLTRNMITTAGILLQCKNLLKRDVRVPWRTEAARIETVLDTSKTEESAVAGVMAALEAGRSMPPTIKSHLRGFVVKLIAAHREMVKTSQPDPSAQWEPTAHDPAQPVLKLLLKRLRDHLITRMGANSNSERFKATSLAGEKLASSGLAEFVDRVKEMADVVSKVGAVDREAHALWWETVAEKIEAENASGAVTPDAGTATNQ